MDYLPTPSPKIPQVGETVNHMNPVHQQINIRQYLWDSILGWLPVIYCYCITIGDVGGGGGRG